MKIVDIPHRFFAEYEERSVTEIVKISTHDKQARVLIKEMVKARCISDVNKLYVLSPIYGVPSTGEIFDIQIGVTGKAKKREDTRDAFNRELGEELGFSIIEAGFEDAFCDSKRVYSIGVNTKYISGVNGNFKSVADVDDDYSRKLCVLAIGDIDEVTRLFSDNNFGNRRVDGEVDIIGVAALPFKIVLEHLRM